MAQCEAIVTYCNERLHAASFVAYCPTGLQVEGRADVRRIVCGVPACQALLAAAIGEGADLVLVLLGYFWRG